MDHGDLIPKCCLHLLHLLLHPIALLPHHLDHGPFFFLLGQLSFGIERVHVVIIDLLAKLVLVRLKYLEYLLQFRLVLVNILHNLLVILVPVVEIALSLSSDPKWNKLLLRWRTSALRGGFRSRLGHLNRIKSPFLLLFLLSLLFLLLALLHFCSCLSHLAASPKRSLPGLLPLLYLL